MKFTEDKLEQVFIALLGEEGIPHLPGNAISRNVDEVLIKEDLKHFLLGQYKKEDLTESEVDQIIRQLEVMRLPTFTKAIKPS